MDFITMCDGYKLDHRRQYPQNTHYVYSNFTPRSSRIEGVNKVVFFGLQHFLQEYLGRIAMETFFDRPLGQVIAKYRRMVENYLGPDAAKAIGIEHIARLHEYGAIPLQFWALPEGTHVPLRVPMFTFQNTEPEFFWVTNYIETLLSSVIWPMCTSATTAYRYRSLLDEFARKTGGDLLFTQWQGHDFSFRGLEGPEAAARIGAGHLLSFTGTDTIPAIQLLEDSYTGTGLIGGSVAATEHSVMCAGGEESELRTFNRLLDLYPTGILSVVSDTWDLWKVIGEILPALKDRILARGGKLVIRPDSGDPVEILTGSKEVPTNSSEKSGDSSKGVVEALWDIFGGTTNERGYKVLDPHIGTIYGDSITYERCREICERLEAKGFASTNVVFGIGSYTYQYTTRDTYGFAVKATWAKIGDKEHFLYKDPKTDDGVKKSARGRLIITQEDEGLVMQDGLSLVDEQFYYEQFSGGNKLRPVWKNGKFFIRQTLDEVRQKVYHGI